MNQITDRFLENFQKIGLWKISELRFFCNSRVAWYSKGNLTLRRKPSRIASRYILVCLDRTRGSKQCKASQKNSKNNFWLKCLKLLESNNWPVLGKISKNWTLNFLFQFSCSMIEQGESYSATWAFSHCKPLHPRVAW